MKKQDLTGKQQAEKMANAMDPDKQKTPGHGKGSMFSAPDGKLQPDNLPKVGANKSFEEITSTSVVVIPENTVKPVNGRIFATATEPGERMTESGIILADAPLKKEDPNAFLNKDASQKDRKRFWVIDFAEDIPFKLERGVEIYPFWVDEALGYNPQMVRDFPNNHSDYWVFHYTEIAGVSKLEHEKLEK